MLFTSRSTPTVFVEKESSLQQAVMALLGWILVVPFLMPGTDTTLLVMSNGGNQTTAQHGMRSTSWSEHFAVWSLRFMRRYHWNCAVFCRTRRIVFPFDLPFAN